jgi:succinate dehydrogenase / fumarate reductase cytochrome b subunit
MNWLFRTFISSAGKKQIMAVTGLGFCLFLATHLVGNLTLYGGRDFFLSYVDHLHALGYLVTAAEIGLIVCAVVHICTGLLLFLENNRARPVSYAVKKGAGGSTLGSTTAPYTGLLILVFIIVHLLTFRLLDKTGTNDYLLLTRTFDHFGWALFYVVGVVIVAVHVSHGFWSGFQTLGLNHPKYMPFIRKVSVIYSVVVGAGFASIPIFIFSLL